MVGQKSNRRHNDRPPSTYERSFKIGLCERARSARKRSYGTRASGGRASVRATALSSYRPVDLCLERLERGNGLHVEERQDLRRIDAGYAFTGSIQ